MDSRQHADLFALCSKVIDIAERVTKPFLFSYTLKIESGLAYRSALAQIAEDDEYLFCFQQPARSNAGVYGLGVAFELCDHTMQRFAAIQRLWRRELKEALTFGELSDCPGSGLIAVGGFGFSAKQNKELPLRDIWRPFPAAALVVPEMSLAEFGEETSLTLTVVVAPGSSEVVLRDVLEQRWQRAMSWVVAAGKVSEGEKREQRKREMDSRSLHPTKTYMDAVRSATEKIADGVCEKVVLARVVCLEARESHQVCNVLANLQERFEDCFLFWVRREGVSFVGATPELLLRREGLRLTTMSLAGSIERGHNEQNDIGFAQTLLQSTKDRGEQSIVTEEIIHTLQPFSVWVTTLDEPAVIQLANIQHLATPIRAQLKQSTSTFELLAALHPTPAVGGQPRDQALAFIAELEHVERGWYASPIGWVDAHENAEFCVGLRSAVIDDRRAYCYAGVGVVAQSNPEKELAETELKLTAMVSALR